MADKEKTIDKIDFEVCSVLSGQTTSTSIDLRGTTLCGLHLPSALTSTTVEFSSSGNGGDTFIKMADGSGSDVSKTIAANKYIPLNPADFAGIQFLRLVFGSAESGDREVILSLRQV